MIRTDRLLPLAVAMLTLAGCDRPAQPGKGVAPNTAATTKTSGSQSSPQIDPVPDPRAVSRVIEMRDVEVAGKSACALMLRYAGGLDQPATWRGESCGKIAVRFVTKADLIALGQASKLDEYTAANLEQLPGGRVLYIEGSFASAIFPLNEAGRIYRANLAD